MCDPANMAANLSNEQEIATKNFLEKVNAKYRRKIGPVPWSTAVRFLYARKFDVVRAVALFEQHELTRQREGLNNFDPLSEPLKTELMTGKFTVLQKRDNTDAAIAVFTAHKHIPANSTHQITLQGVVFQLDCALQDIVTQKAGIVFIYDMSNSKYSNFDYDLSQKILTLLKIREQCVPPKTLIIETMNGFFKFCGVRRVNFDIFFDFPPHFRRYSIRLKREADENLSTSVVEENYIRLICWYFPEDGE